MDLILLKHKPRLNQVLLGITEMIDFQEKTLFPTYYISPPPGSIQIYDLDKCQGCLLNVDEDLVKEKLGLGRNTMIYPKIIRNDNLVYE